MIVLDASPLLAIFFEEVGGYELIDRAEGGAISAVNWCEVCTKITDRGYDLGMLAPFTDKLKLRFVPFDKTQAEIAASLRAKTRHFGLSLGDRACLALARTLGAPVLTADRAWRDLEVGVKIELIR